MVRYGPWVQEPEYEEVVSWNTTQARRALAGEGYTSPGLGVDFEATDIQADSYSVDPYYQLPGMLEAEVGAGKYLSDTPSPWVSLSYGGAGFLPGNMYESRSTVRAGTSITPLVAGRPSGAASGVAPFYWGPDVWPDNAIDIEYEDDNAIAEWLSVALDPSTVLSGRINERGPTNADTWRSVSQPFYTKIKIGIGGFDVGSIVTNGEGDYEFSSDGTDAATRSIGGSAIDLSDFVAPGPSSYGEPLAMVTGQFVPVRVAPTGDGGVWQWSYGWGWHEARLRWTLRPPRYRWIYDTVPIRQTFARDDHLAGGAYQTWPPPKSEQESNRTFGGYV